MTPCPPAVEPGNPSLNPLNGIPPRSLTKRILLGNPGNPPAVGVAGRTLTLWCGERAVCSGVLDCTDVDTDPLDEVDDALLWEWWCAWCMERTDETDEDVDLRPRRPADPEVRRTVERGVSGEGEREWRLWL